MDEPSQQSALIAAMTTEHFVLQTAASSTISEAAARSTLYVMALSSSLVAMGFLAQSRELLVAIVLPAVFRLGLLTDVLLVDTALENMQTWRASRASAASIGRSDAMPPNISAPSRTGGRKRRRRRCDSAPSLRSWERRQA